MIIPVQNMLHWKQSKWKSSIYIILKVAHWGPNVFRQKHSPSDSHWFNYVKFGKDNVKKSKDNVNTIVFPVGSEMHENTNMNTYLILRPYFN